MSKKHSKLSPSATSRWLNCPGSIALSEGQPDETSVYAAEGTVAHDLAESGLLTGKPASELTDNTEMAVAVQVYLDEINRVRGEVDVVIEHTEKTLKSTRIDGLGGTSDHYMVYTDGGKLVLHVFDYKHGMGVAVDIVENKQVLSYFEIIESTYLDTFDEYRGTIVQPRAFEGQPVQTWCCTSDRVKGHREAILDAKGKDDLKAGDWCRWCKAIKVCPAVEQHTLEIAQMEFSEVRDDTEKLLELERIAPAVKKLLDLVPSALVAKFRDGSGGVPGYKCIERMSHRRWVIKDAHTLDAALEWAGVDMGSAYNKTLKTPAQLEKTLPNKKVISSLVERQLVGYKVVPETHRSEPADFSVNEFTEYRDDEEN